jgi:hypothetical protein
MFWLVDTPLGQKYVEVSPCRKDSDKDRISAELRRFFKEQNVFRYAMAMECWVSENSDNIAPEDDPNRQERVMITADDECKKLFALREIIRPAHGKPYRGKLGKIDNEFKAEGRFMNMLSHNFPHHYH